VCTAGRDVKQKLQQLVQFFVAHSLKITLSYYGEQQNVITNGQSH